MITKSILTIYMVIISITLHGSSIFDQSTPNKFVNDFANILLANEEHLLESKLQRFNDESSTQIAIVTVKSLEGYSSAQFSQKLAEQWGVGQKGNNNGVLIVIKPKYYNEKGEVYISVGYGLEHVIPDAMAKRIVDKILIPKFKREKFYDGLNDAIDRIIKITRGEYSNNKTTAFDKNQLSLFLIIILVLTLSIPVFYLRYLKTRKIPDKYNHFYIHGEYTAANVFNQIELIEQKFNKNYKKFKRQVKKYELVSKKNLIKYSDKIDRNMFCYLLNGRSRKKMFWQMADPFLKFIVIYLITILVFGSAIVFVKTNIFGLLIGLIFSYIVILGLFSILISFLEMYQHILRKNALYVGGVSVALFALNAYFKRNIKRRYNANTSTYTYYPHVVVSSCGYSGGGFGGGFSGGGGFGGGSFGGGGAGGSW